MWPLAALKGVSYKKMYERFAGTNKVAVITSWPLGGDPLCYEDSVKSKQK